MSIPQRRCPVSGCGRCGLLLLAFKNGVLSPPSSIGENLHMIRSIISHRDVTKVAPLLKTIEFDKLDGPDSGLELTMQQSRAEAMQSGRLCSSDQPDNRAEMLPG
ncbi:hypothetical protein FRC18_005904 [Serendipita sp. 400]|nr:hypothetical protein FRC18_005904 [Serendipita sp. 400]